MSFHSTPTLEQDVRDCSWKYRSSRRHTFHSWLLRYGRQASLPRPWSGWWGWWCGQPCTWSASPRWLAGSRGPPPRWARPVQPPCVIVIVIASSTTTLCDQSENLWIVENSLGSSDKGAGDAELPLHSPGKILALLVPLVRDSLEAPPCFFVFIIDPLLKDYLDRQPSARIEFSRIPVSGLSASRRTISALRQSAWEILWFHLFPQTFYALHYWMWNGNIWKQRCNSFPHTPKYFKFVFSSRNAFLTISSNKQFSPIPAV